MMKRRAHEKKFARDSPYLEETVPRQDEKGKVKKQIYPEKPANGTQDDRRSVRDGIGGERDRIWHVATRKEKKGDVGRVVVPKG